MTACVDLAARFGDRFRLNWEADDRTKLLWPREDHPWLYRIPCRYGHVGVQGGELLYAFSDRPRIGRQLRTLPFIERAAGDLEVRIVFQVDQLAAVLAILRPYRRRRLSNAARAELVDRGAATRFGSAEGTRRTERVPSPRMDALARVDTWTTP